MPDTKSGARFFETTAGAGSVDSTSEAIRGGLTPRNILFLLGAAIPAFFMLILAVNKPKIRCRSSEEMLCLARSLFLFCAHLWAMIRLARR